MTQKDLVAVRLDKELVDTLKQEAAQQGHTLSSYIRWTLESRKVKS